jgi:glutamyl-tRNA reductase
MEEARENAEARALAVHEAERKIEQALREFFLEQKELPILRDFSAVEPAVLHELHSAFVGLSDELPNEYLLKVQKWAEKLLKKQLHTSREHLRLVLRKEISPRDAAV